MATTSETTETCGMAVSILQATRDGDELHKSDLWLLQCAVNGHLSVDGIDAFKELHQIVSDGEYNTDERWKT